jgi:rubrerythrin
LAEGFTNVYNVSGGIIAYNGGKAFGAEDFGLEYFVQGNFADAFQMSYAMEEGLRQLYLAMENMVDGTEEKALLERLASFEQGHKEKLKGMFPGNPNDVETAATVLEGGFDRQQMLEYFQKQTGSLTNILQLGMMLETQALDLYSRLSRQTDDKESKELFEYMAKEEMSHLRFLSKEFDKIT